MPNDLPASLNPLTVATDDLRDLCSDPRMSPATIDPAAVGRIIAHITNINRSVVMSTQDHCNAAKRLNDFATTFERLARRSVPPADELAARIASVATHLRAASKQLTECDAVPDWRAPEPAGSEIVL